MPQLKTVVYACQHACQPEVWTLHRAQSQWAWYWQAAPAWVQVLGFSGASQDV